MSQPHASVDSRLPIYQKLRDQFAAKISSGTWGRDGSIPSENQLAEEYGVAVGTIRKAIEKLVTEGLLERKQGRGTSVRRPDFGNALFRFFRHAGIDGQVIKPTSQIIERRIEPASPVLAKALQIKPGASLLCFFRQRSIDKKPVLVEDIAVDATKFAALITLPIEEFGDLFYPLYDRVCGRIVARAAEMIRFGSAEARIAEALQCAPGTAVVIIERMALAPDGQPLEWRRSFGRADRFSYTIELR
jgi:GntR family transcriptional regulator